MNSIGSLKGLYDGLGQLAECPREDYRDTLESCRRGLMELCPEGSASLAQFQKATEGWSKDEREEAYLRVFDISPVAVPYVSVHLFGEENYRRGEFMARLHQAFGEKGFECGGELPDHFALLTRFAGRLEGEEREELLSLCLKEPLVKMRVALEKAGNPYRHLLQALLDVLETDLKKEACHA